MGDFQPELQVNGFLMFSLIASMRKSSRAIGWAVAAWITIEISLCEIGKKTLLLLWAWKLFILLQTLSATDGYIH
jgi:hypothetical protein